MLKYIAIAGTGGADRFHDWDAVDSNFSQFLAKHDCTQLVLNPLKRYMWSTMVDGLVGKNDTWDAAGRALANYIAPPLEDHSLIRPEDTFIISHSHGGNVVAYACGIYDLKISGLITVGTPIRKDLYDVYKAASGNIQRHLHIHAGWRDFWQILGSIHDGRWGIHREHPFARNEKTPGGHGTVLRDPTLYNLWDERGWLKFWKGE